MPSQRQRSSWVDVPSQPPKVSRPRASGSYTSEWWSRATGPFSTTRVQRFPSYSHVSANESFRSLRPPFSTTTLREGSNAIAA